MSDESGIRDSIRAIVGTGPITFATLCTVDNINLTDNTCDCSPLDDSADFLGVKLLAQDSNGFLIVPKDGSVVRVSMIDADTGYLSGFSEIDKVVIYIDASNKLEFDLNGLIINDGLFGGLIKIDSLISQTTSQIAAIKTAVLAGLAVIDTQLIALGQAGGSGTAFSGSATSILNLNKNLLENTKVKH